MTERNDSPDSFLEFFDTVKKETVTPNNGAIAALIKTQPVVHQRRTSSDTKGRIEGELIIVDYVISTATTNSKKLPLTTIVKDSLVKSKHIESPRAPPTVTSNYESG